jgi:hypothetical protein
VLREGDAGKTMTENKTPEQVIVKLSDLVKREKYELKIPPYQRMVTFLLVVDKWGKNLLTGLNKLYRI